MADAEALDYRTIDEIIHGRVRLSVMAFLSGAGSADFALIKAQIGVTDGNLSANLRKLEDAGYIGIAKTFVDRRPQTCAVLTDKGRAAWLAYLDRIEGILSTARRAKD